jgi:hypothetical protein
MKSYEQLIDEARTRNRQRDRDERKGKYAAPSDCPLDIQVATAMAAIKCAIIAEDWSTVAEAYALLEDTLGQLPRTKSQ